MRQTSIILFITVLGIIFYTPIINSLLPVKYKFVSSNIISERDSRALVKKFKFNEPWQFTESFTKFYDKNFKGRDYYYNLYTKLMIDFFGTSPIDEVSLGKSKWLFLGSSSALKDYLNISRLGPSEINEIKDQLEDNKGFLDSLSIKYLVVVVPNKHSIYTEYLKDRFFQNETPSNLEMLDSTLQCRSVPFLNLTSALHIEKDKTFDLYYNSDSHWNDFGAYIGFKNIVKSLNKIGIDKVKESCYSQIKFKNVVNYYNNDLSEMLLRIDAYRCNATIIDTSSVYFTIKEDLKPTNVPKQFYHRPEWYSLQSVNSSKPYYLMIFRDSFTSHLQRYFSNAYGKCWYIWEPQIDKIKILVERPDVVLQIIVERNLQNLVLKK